MSDFFKKHVVWFIIFAVIVSAVTFGMMQRANRNLAENHRVIVENQNKSAALVDSLMGIRILLANDSAKFLPAHVDRLSNSLEDAISTLDAHQNNARIGNLLELEFSKIQNEYEVLNLWCALLTVVFLIFSFFSIFKTNEMTRQGEEALEALKTTSREAKTKSDSIEEQVTKAEERIGKKENEIVAGLNKKIEDLNKGLSANGKNLEDLEGRVSSQSDIIKDLEGKKNAVIVDIEEKVKDLEDKLYDKINRAITSQSDLKLKTFSDTIVDLQNSQDALRDMVIGVMSQIKITDSIEAENSMQEEMDDMDIREEEPEDEEKTDEIESKSEDTCHNPAN